VSNPKLVSLPDILASAKIKKQLEDPTLVANFETMKVFRSDGSEAVLLHRTGENEWQWRYPTNPHWVPAPIEEAVKLEQRYGAWVSREIVE
jgi:hypothetical protein